MRRAAFLLFAVALFTAPARASFGDSDAGTGAALFLRLPAGAREAAMGETGAAFADGADAMYWNPALLGQVRERHLLASHNAYVESSAHSFAAVQFPRPSAGGWGVAVNYFSAGSIPQIDEAGAQVGDFTPRDLAAAAGYGLSVGRARIGASAKYINSRLINSASTFSFDIGLAASFFRGRTSVGAVGQNLAGELRFNDASEDVAKTVRAGVAQRVGRGLLISVEAVAGTGLPVRPAGGVELSLGGPARGRMQLRAGYSGALAADKEDLAGLTAGLGLGFGVFNADYVWVPLGDLGNSHRVSLSLRLPERVRRSGASSTTDKAR